MAEVEEVEFLTPDGAGEPDAQKAGVKGLKIPDPSDEGNELPPEQNPVWQKNLRHKPKG